MAQAMQPQRNRALQQQIRDFVQFQQRLDGVPLPAKSSLIRGEPSEGLCLVIQRCRVRIAAGIASSTAVRSGALSLRYTVTLYDASTSTFFGRSYRSSRCLPLRELGAELVECGGDICYSVTSLKDANTVAIVEPTLVVSDRRTGAIQHEISLAWAPLYLFQANKQWTDVSEPRAATEPASEVGLFVGSPRALAVAPPGTVYPQMNGCVLVYKLQKHSGLLRMRHLVFDSEVFGPLDPIPGLLPVQVPLGIADIAGAQPLADTVVGATPATSKIAKRSGIDADTNTPFQRWWSPCLAPSTSAAFLEPQFPQLAPRLRLQLCSPRVYLPPTFDTRLQALLCAAREVEMGLRAGSLTTAHVRIIQRVLSVQISNGHTVLHRSTVTVSEQFATMDSEAEMRKTMALLAGGSTGPAAAASGEAPSSQAAQGSSGAVQNTAGQLALQGSTLLGAETDVILNNYTPDESMAILVSLEYVIAEPTSMGLGIQTRLTLPPPPVTEVSGSASTSGDSAHAAQASGPSAQGSTAGVPSPAAQLFSGNTTLETRRHVLVARQVYLPCETPAAHVTEDAGGPPRKRVFFANRASKSDPQLQQTFTRRSLEIPLSSPNPDLRLTTGVWMDGGGLEGLLQDAGLRHLYGASNPVLGVNVQVSIDSSPEATVSVVTQPGGGPPVSAPKGVRATGPSGRNKAGQLEPVKTAVAAQQKKITFQEDEKADRKPPPVQSDSESEEEYSDTEEEDSEYSSEEEDRRPSRSPGRGKENIDQTGLPKSPPRRALSPQKQAQKAPLSPAKGAATSPVRGARQQKPQGRGRRHEDDGYESPASVEDSLDDTAVGRGDVSFSSARYSALRATGAAPSAGETLLAQLMGLPLTQAGRAGTAGPNLYLPPDAALMVMPGPLVSADGYGPRSRLGPYPYPGGAGGYAGSYPLGASTAMMQPYAQSAGDATLPFGRSAHHTSPHGYPLSFVDRERLVKLGIGVQAGLSQHGTTASAAGDAHGPHPALVGPAASLSATMAVELSDRLSASTLSLTFAAYLPNALTVPGTGTGAADTTLGNAGVPLDATLLELPNFSSTTAFGGPGGTMTAFAGSATSGSGNVPAAPRRVYFSFQLYSGTTVRTQPATLHKVPAGHPDSPPVYLLSSSAGKAGVTVRLEADPGAFAPSERASFVHYLATSVLCVECWDADSLLPLGTADIALAHLLRQQAPAVVSAREYDVVSCLASSGASMGGGASTADGTALPITGLPAIGPDGSSVSSSGAVVGRLQVVMSSIGRTGSSRYADPEALVVRPYGADHGTPSLAATAALGHTLGATGPMPPAAMSARAGRGRAGRVKAHAQPLSSSSSDRVMGTLVRMSGAGHALDETVNLHGSLRAGQSLVDTMHSEQLVQDHALTSRESMLVAQAFATSAASAGTSDLGTSVDYRAFLRFVLEGDTSGLHKTAQDILVARTVSLASVDAGSIGFVPQMYACIVCAARESTLSAQGIYTPLHSAAGGMVDSLVDLTVASIADFVEDNFSKAERYVARKGERLARLQSRGTSRAGTGDAVTTVAEEDDPSLPGALEDPEGGTKGEAQLSAAGSLPKGLMTLPRILYTLGALCGVSRTLLDDPAQLTQALEAAYPGRPQSTWAGLLKKESSVQSIILPWEPFLQHVLRVGSEALPMPDQALTVAQAVHSRSAEGATDVDGVLLRPQAALLRRKLQQALVSNPHCDLLSHFREADQAVHGGMSGHLSWPDFCRILRDAVGVKVYTGATSSAFASAGSSSGSAAILARVHASDRGLPAEAEGDLEKAVQLDVVAAYREGVKSDKVRALLRESVTTTMHIYPCPGRAVYLEVTLHNPFRHEERFALRVTDPSLPAVEGEGDSNQDKGELRLLTDTAEWAYWRAHAPLACPDPGLSPVLGPGDVRARVWGRGGPQGQLTVLLLPGEHITLPLVFLSFKDVPLVSAGDEEELAARHAFSASEVDGADQGRTGGQSAVTWLRQGSMLAQSRGAGGGSVLPESTGVPLEPGKCMVPRAILLSLDSTSHMQSVGLVRVEVHPRPGPVHRNVRFLAPENGHVKASLPIPLSASMTTGYGSVEQTSSGAVAPAGRFVRVADTDSGSAVVSVVEAGMVRELRLRATVSTFPSTTSVRVYLYADPYCVDLVACWRVHLHASLSFDVHAAVGQSTGVELVVRGGHAPKRVALYASDPREVMFASSPSGSAGGSGGLGQVLSLVPRALNRLDLSIRPLTPGPRTLLLNMVDLDSVSGTPALVAAWMVTAGVSTPAITRVYDVTVTPPLVGGTQAAGEWVSKKIPYTNEWDVPRTYSILSSLPLVRVKDARLTVGPKSTGYIRLALRQLPQLQAVGSAREDAYLYINDEAGRNEETLLLRLSYPSMA